MDKPKRRSSLLKKPSEDDNTLIRIGSTRKTNPHRRISFSGKKSVRVFSCEDVPKTYDNSYEESDHAANGSGENDNLGHKIVDVHQKRIALRNRVVVASDNCKINNSMQQLKIKANKNQNVEVGKENSITFSKFTTKDKKDDVAQAQLNPNTEATTLFVKKPKYNSPPFCSSTFEFINQTAGNDTVLNVEDSVDITLYEREMHNGVLTAKKTNKIPSTYKDFQRVSNSFRLQEHERQILKNDNYNEYCMSNPCEMELQNISPNSLKTKQSAILENQCSVNKTNVTSLNMDMSSNEIIVEQNKGKSNRKTITNAESISQSFSTNEPSSKIIFPIHNDESMELDMQITKPTNSKHRTIKNDYDMELSGTYEVYDKENIFVPNLKVNGYIENKENLPIDLRRKTNKDVQNMEVSGIEIIEDDENVPQILKSSNIRKADEPVKSETFYLDISNELHLRRKTIKDVQNMELSGIENIEDEENVPQILKSSNKIKADEPVKSETFYLDISNELQDEVLDVVKASSCFNEKINRISLGTISEEIRRNEEEFEDFFRSTVMPPKKQLQHVTVKDISEMDISINLNETDVTNKCPQNNLQETVDFCANKLDQDLEMSFKTYYGGAESCLKNKRATIVFNDKEAFALDISKSNEMITTDLEGQNDKIIECNTIGIKNDATNGNEQVLIKQSNITPKKGAIPKVVVVHKKCATNVKKKTPADMQLQRFQRYQNKQKENVLYDPEIISTIDKNENHTLEGTIIMEQSFLSPESHAIFPQHCKQYGSSQKFNFMQLHKVIESGKIQLFPDAKKSSHKKLKNLNAAENIPKMENNNMMQNSNEMDIEIQQLPLDSSSEIKQKKYSKNRQTMNLSCDMDLEQSILKENATNQNQVVIKMDPINTLNVAKCILQEKNSRPNSNSNSNEDSFAMKLKEARFAYGVNNNPNLSPLPNSSDQEERLRRLHEGTPHRSVIEFEDLEKELCSAKFESSMKNDIKITNNSTCEPLDMDLDQEPSFQGGDVTRLSNIPTIAQKRSTINLTPHFPEAKKRSTKLFENYNIGKEFTKTTNSAARKTILLTKEMEIEDYSLIPAATNCEADTQLEITSIDVVNAPKDISMESITLQKNNVNVIPDININSVSEETINASLCQTSPTPANSSHIPISIGCARKNNSIKAKTLSPKIFENCNIGKQFTATTDNAARQTILLAKEMEIEDCSLIPADTNCETATQLKISPKDVNVRKDISMESITLEKNNVDIIPDINIISVSEETINAPLPQTSPCPSNASHIPILIGSARKNNSIKARFFSPHNASVSQRNETIQTPRRRISKQLDKSIIFIEQSMICEDKSEYIQPVFEDNPITISDVSAYYMSQKNKSNDTIKDYAIFNELNEDTQTKANFLKKKFVDLSFSADDIDDTRLSLVGTLLDEDNDDEEYNDKMENKDAFEIINKPSESLACRKCKRCQNTIKEETLNTTESFSLPEMPPLPDLGIESLRRLRAKPTIDETIEYWRRAHLATDTSPHDDDDDDDETKSEDESEDLLKQFEEILKRNEKAMEEEMRLMRIFDEQPPFYERLDMRISENLPNWIFNYQMVIHNFCIFDHKKITTFSLKLFFEPKDPLRKNFIIKCIKLGPSIVPTRHWKPIDFLLDFQLKLELPYNLNEIYRRSKSDEDSIYDVLVEVDKICVRVEELGMLFWKTVCKENATLIREPHNTYVRKIVRRLIPPNKDIKYHQVQRTEFKIEVTNIRKICFKDIVSPPLHLFREDLENLPTGLDFISVFLRDPVSYLKT